MARKKTQKERPREELSREERWPDGRRFNQRVLADKVGCSIQTIQNYHARGLLDPEPLHEEQNFRKNHWGYTERDLKIASEQYAHAAAALSIPARRA